MNKERSSKTRSRRRSKKLKGSRDVSEASERSREKEELVEHALVPLLSMSNPQSPPSSLSQSGSLLAMNSCPQTLASSANKCAEFSSNQFVRQNLPSQDNSNAGPSVHDKIPPLETSLSLGHSSSLSPPPPYREWNDIRSQIRLKKRAIELLKNPFPSSPPNLSPIYSSPQSSSSSHIIAPSPILSTSSPSKISGNSPTFALSPKMEKWDRAEVCIFLSTLGMEQYQQVGSSCIIIFD